jgi:hypothetical protein
MPRAKPHLPSTLRWLLLAPTAPARLDVYVHIISHADVEDGVRVEKQQRAEHVAPVSKADASGVDYPSCKQRSSHILQGQNVPPLSSV